MRKPRVFVSSTFYDLKQVRADMKRFLEELGLEPLLSEYNSFPVNPDVGTVDNCLAVVKDNAEIFCADRWGKIWLDIERRKVSNESGISRRQDEGHPDFCLCHTSRVGSFADMASKS